MLQRQHAHDCRNDDERQVESAYHEHRSRFWLGWRPSSPVENTSTENDGGKHGKWNDDEGSPSDHTNGDGDERDHDRSGAIRLWWETLVEEGGQYRRRQEPRH